MTKAADSPRWCETCQKYGDHHTDRHPKPAFLGMRIVADVSGRDVEEIYAAIDKVLCPTHDEDQNPCKIEAMATTVHEDFHRVWAWVHEE